ncbi:hypothetical protein ACW95P_01770 [Candidatus Mycoplasma pogonae]
MLNKKIIKNIKKLEKKKNKALAKADAILNEVLKEFYEFKIGFFNNESENLHE